MEELDHQPGGFAQKPQQKRTDYGFGGLAAEPPGEDNGFDYQDNQNAFEDRFGGGMEEALGYDQDDNLLAMEEELNNANQNQDGGAQDTFEITLSIVMDEDDPNTLGLNLHQLFGGDPDKKCYQVKVSCHVSFYH